MSLLTWRNGEPLPTLDPLTGFHTASTTDIARVAQQAELSTVEVRRRFTEGHRCYVASLGEEPVAYGWVARQQASVGELRLQFTLWPDTAYLWDFATRVGWRGRGVYPRLLQAVLRSESAHHFWILHAPENSASRQGIRKAGFAPVGRLSFRVDTSVALAPAGDSGRAQVAGRVFQVPLLGPSDRDSLNPCWRCFIARQRARASPSRLCGPECTCAGPVADVQ